MTLHTQRSCLALSILLITLWVVRTAEAQDYPHYPPAGSTFVPLDSWVYPALERLAAFGYVTTSLEGMKPWARTECARLTVEAGDALREAILEDKRPAEEPVQIHSALEREFAAEIEVMGGGRNRSFRLESVYARAMSISGPPLTDGFHFGQTIAYDFGRPFRRGFNAISGGAVRATAGPFAFYVRAEYQHAPGAPALSDSVRSLIANVDRNPLRPAQSYGAVNPAVLLEAYGSINVGNWQFSFGKQSLDWGIGAEGGLLLSDNAESIEMGRLTRTLPARLPGILSKAGPYRLEFFVGRLQSQSGTRGNTIPLRPWIYGQKISFRPGPHVEVGYGRTTMIGGTGGDPFTFKNFFLSYFGLPSNAPNPAGAGQPTLGKPGNSQNALDIVIRIPRVRYGVQLYADLYQDDEAIFFYRAGRGSYRPGIYIGQLPWLPKLDFRAEYASTESYGEQTRDGTLNYFHTTYRDGQTNNGFLLGDTVGREGTWTQFWSTYHFSPRNSLQLNFKSSTVDAQFIPGGGSWQDYGVRHEIHFRSGFYVKSSLQFEHIASFPSLFNGKVNNVAASVELGFAPELRKQ